MFEYFREPLYDQIEKFLQEIQSRTTDNYIWQTFESNMKNILIEWKNRREYTAIY